MFGPTYYNVCVCVLYVLSAMCVCVYIGQESDTEGKSFACSFLMATKIKET